MVRDIKYIRQLKLVSHEAESSSLQIRFFEYEWKHKNAICLSMLDNKNGKSKKIFARKTSLKEVSSYNSSEFLFANHIQGPIQGSVRFGLYYENDLVSLMTFGKSRYNTNYQWELLRFCNKVGYTVVGGASKLLKHFEVVCKPETLISYANKRWSEGNLYEKLGFKHLYDSPPSYYYFKLPDLRLYHRTVFQKHKLSEKLESYNPDFTEVQNMLNNGWRQIFDQGNKVYLKEYKV